MAQPQAYLLLKLLLEKHLLVIRYVELLALLNTLEGQGRITIEEGNELLNLAENLKRYDLTINE